MLVTFRKNKFIYPSDELKGILHLVLKTKP